MEKYFHKTCALHRDGMQNRMEAPSKCIILSDFIMQRWKTWAHLALRATPLILMYFFLLATNTRNLPCRQIQLRIGQMTTDLFPVSSYRHFTINLCFSSDFLNWRADNKHQAKARLTADTCNNIWIMSSWKHHWWVADCNMQQQACPSGVQHFLVSPGNRSISVVVCATYSAFLYLVAFWFIRMCVLSSLEIFKFLAESSVRKSIPLSYLYGNMTLA